HRLVDHLRRNVDDQRAAAGRLPAVPAPVRPVVHARRDTLMKVLQWNVQWCRGVDGKVDPARIASEAKELCDPDVCCFQEVAVNYPDLDAPGDQPALLARHMPGYSAHFA